MVREIPKTNSDSSAESMMMNAPGEDNRPGRITEPGFTSTGKPLGSDPISTSTSVKVTNFTSPTRITDDHENKKSGERGNSPLDGQNEIMPADAPKKTFIVTSFSK